MASRLRKVSALLDKEEMKGLLSILQKEESALCFYEVGTLRASGSGALSIETFLEIHGEYIEVLKSGQEVPLHRFRAPFSTLLTGRENTLSVQHFPDGRFLWRPLLPGIQLTPHVLFYSCDRDIFHEKAFGAGGISFGVTFSYPGLFEDPSSKEILSVNDTFPNTALFRTLQRWMRDHTLPTPFVASGKKRNLPTRLGKECFAWIGKRIVIS